MTHKDNELRMKLVEIINTFIQENRLVNADICSDESELKGLHSGLTIGGAHPIIDEISDIFTTTLQQRERAIEKDILELLGWEDNYRLYLVADTKKPIEENQAEAKNILRARNLLRAELRLKLKEYIGTLDRSTNGKRKEESCQ